jgi:hypothetical protein
MNFQMSARSSRPSKWQVGATALLAIVSATMAPAVAQNGRSSDAYRPPSDGGYSAPSEGRQPYDQRDYGQPAAQSANSYGTNPAARADDSYRPGTNQPPPDREPAYQQGRPPQDQPAYGQPYSAAPQPYADERPSPRYSDERPGPRYSDERPGPRAETNSPSRGYYAEGEIMDKGRGFFGSISQGLASAIEYTYSKAGRPNGYILGEDGGGAFFAGLRYGEGKLFTKDAGDHKVFWQGPSLGYDVGGEGSKTMVLVYNMSDPGDIYRRFGGVEGSAYVVGGVSVQFQKNDDVTLAIIRSGVGLRLGANVGYLKYTRSPTWNPF